MIFTIIIGIWLIAAIAKGWQNGLAATVISAVGGVLIWFAAFHFYPQLAGVIGRGQTTMGYALTAFFIIVVVGYLILHGLLMAARALKWIPIIKQANSIGGALLAGAFNYLLIFVTLALALMIDTPWVQNQYNDSKTAQFIVNKTPLLSSNAIQNWINDGSDDQNTPDDSTDPTNQSSSSSSESSRNVNAASASDSNNSSDQTQNPEQKQGFGAKAVQWFDNIFH